MTLSELSIDAVRGLPKGKPETATVATIASRLRRIELKSLILAQIERWRHALHMQVERERGATPE